MLIFGIGLTRPEVRELLCPARKAGGQGLIIHVRDVEEPMV